MAITKFRGENYALSSMFPVANGVETPDGAIVGSIEIGYQAYKFADPAIQKIILGVSDGYQAKRLARRMEREGEPIVDDWGESRLGVMRWFVWQKFGRNQPEADYLLGTYDQELVEGNTWGDDFWGAIPMSDEPGQFVGRNNLGLLLMQGRSLLMQGVDLIADANSDEIPVSGGVRVWPSS